jgi:hypothetical protein
MQSLLSLLLLDQFLTLVLAHATIEILTNTHVLELLLRNSQLASQLVKALFLCSELA